MSKKLLQAKGRKIVKFQIPHLKGDDGLPLDIYVRTWTVAERLSFEEQIKEPTPDVFGKIAVMSVCDADGKLEFTEEDLPALRHLDLDALQQIADKALDLNRLGPKAVEQAAKN